MATDQSPRRIAAAVMNRMADTIERSPDGSFRGYADIAVALDLAIGDLLSTPIAYHVLISLKVRRFELWQGTQAEAVRMLRSAAAGASGRLASYQSNAAMRIVDDVREVLRAALGDGAPDGSLLHLAAAVVEKIRAKEERIALLEEELAQLRDTAAAGA